MVDFMGRYASETYALMRVIVGLLILCPAVQKIVGWPQPMPPGVPAFLVYVAGPIELVGGALVAVGFRTREAAFLCSGLMAFAYWMAHGSKHWIPLVNQGELAVVYCFVFLFIAANGPGKWSLDAAR
jgi:putative oxidoreductase